MWAAFFTSMNSHECHVPKSVDRHADIVAGKAKLRRLIDAAGIIAEEAYSDEDAVEDITDNAEKSILEVTRDEERATSRRSGSVRTSWKKFRKFRNKETITGIATGFPFLDALTSGFQKGDFIIVVPARPWVRRPSSSIWQRI